MRLPLYYIIIIEFLLKYKQSKNMSFNKKTAITRTRGKSRTSTKPEPSDATFEAARTGKTNEPSNIEKLMQMKPEDWNNVPIPVT